MEILRNPFFARPESPQGLVGVPYPSTDAGAPMRLLECCPAAGETPLVDAPVVAARCGVARVWIKDERARMGLGSFKALGAAYVIAHDAQAGPLSGITYVTASAGNHGMSVAAGAAAFGARAVVYISEQVSDAFAGRLARQGAAVVREGETYEASMAAAARAAEMNGWRLLSDSSWPLYTDPPHRLMEGYLVLTAEAIRQIPQPPTHIFVQAGVGGLAASVAALAREAWGNGVHIAVVEPLAAQALRGSIIAGKPQESKGPVSAMGRLDCKEPSLIALKGLARDATAFIAITEDEGQAGADKAARIGMASTPSGAAGLAALLEGAVSHRGELGLDAASRVLLILSEGPEA
ncbi:pyridoxal-phosphate dependent enzyme [Seohaeicola zhoushanensis]|uniref:Diaminopropionate ammonia-lyase n=1 Tax=Seohaeicola zhoushanensis TaxID=1569283 RepID=A0A8J3GYF0_9RHOB|nr:pyridoxal-phosphate dependent enzyme [Seohaeicola zhoushanensis]GHF56461.1 diaminopropionate ammonia-lyase [Seohaeicola zhoushanensis]